MQQGIRHGVGTFPYRQNRQYNRMPPCGYQNPNQVKVRTPRNFQYHYQHPQHQGYQHYNYQNRNQPPHHNYLHHQNPLQQHHHQQQPRHYQPPQQSYRHPHLQQQSRNYAQSYNNQVDLLQSQSGGGGGSSSSSSNNNSSNNHHNNSSSRDNNNNNNTNWNRMNIAKSSFPPMQWDNNSSKPPMPQWSSQDQVNMIVPSQARESTIPKKVGIPSPKSYISSRSPDGNFQRNIIAKSTGTVVQPSPKTAMIRCTIVHYTGATFKQRLPDNDMDIYCNEGCVRANCDIMVMASTYFYRKSKMCREIVMMPSMEKGFMFLIVELVTKGRVCVLNTRLRKFLNLVEQLHIGGVFSSEEPDDSLIVSDLALCIIDYLDYFTPVPGDGKQLNCLTCGNSMLSSVFYGHYKSYHSELSEPLMCCDIEFRTYFDYNYHTKKHLPSRGPSHIYYEAK